MGKKERERESVCVLAPYGFDYKTNNSYMGFPYIVSFTSIRHTDTNTQAHTAVCSLKTGFVSFIHGTTNRRVESTKVIIISHNTHTLAAFYWLFC